MFFHTVTELFALLFLNLQRLHVQLFSGDDLQVEPAAARALQREHRKGRALLARPADALGRNRLNLEHSPFHRCPLRRHLESKQQSVRNDLPHVSDLEAHTRYPLPVGVTNRNINHILGNG